MMWRQKLVDTIVESSIAYANLIHTSCASCAPDNPPRLPPICRPTRLNFAGSEKALRDAGKALSLQKQQQGPGGAAAQQEGDADSADGSRGLTDITAQQSSVIVRLNNVHHASKHFDRLWAVLQLKWAALLEGEGGGVSPSAAKHLQHTLHGMERSYEMIEATLVSSVGAMLVYGGLSTQILEQLYVPSVGSARLQATVCEPLRQLMLEVGALLDPELLDAVNAAVTTTMVGAFERVSSRKALALPCVSTGIVSKTVPYLAICLSFRCCLTGVRPESSPLPTRNCSRKTTWPCCAWAPSFGLRLTTAPQTSSALSQPTTRSRAVSDARMAGRSWCAATATSRRCCFAESALERSTRGAALGIQILPPTRTVCLGPAGGAGLWFGLPPRIP
eukprot:SAG22_NODE_575_length_8991_cov_12.134859_15_plen_390_part_00